MAYNTKPIKNDVDGKPIPQYYNPVTDLYEALQGSNGAANHTLYGVDGEPITTTGNKLAVRATEVETLLGTIEGKDFATQTTLAQILAKLISAPATEAKQTALNTLIGEVQAAPTANTLLARLKSLEDKIDAITSGTTPAVTQLSGLSSSDFNLASKVFAVGAACTSPINVAKSFNVLASTPAPAKASRRADRVISAFASNPALVSKVASVVWVAKSLPFKAV
ncbi:MAG TPA: hypothetical protein GXX65_14050, partial [Methanosarcina sp.]|nr:hypothetical protein [Methanosarcina sp.]